MATIPKLRVASDVPSSLNRRGEEFIRGIQEVIAKGVEAPPKAECGSVGFKNTTNVADEFIPLIPSTKKEAKRIVGSWGFARP